MKQKPTNWKKLGLYLVGCAFGLLAVIITLTLLIMAVAGVAPLTTYAAWSFPLASSVWLAIKLNDAGHRLED